MVTTHDPGSLIVSLSSQFNVAAIHAFGALNVTFPEKGKVTCSNPVNDVLVFSDPELPWSRRPPINWFEGSPFLEKT